MYETNTFAVSFFVREVPLSELHVLMQSVD